MLDVAQHSHNEAMIASQQFGIANPQIDYRIAMLMWMMKV